MATETWLVTTVFQAVQHAVRHDTVVVHDTVRVVDTVRMVVHEGPNLLVWIGAVAPVVGLAGGAGWKLVGWWSRRQNAHRRINAEAFSLRRELDATIGTGPLEDQASIWVQGCQRGFDLEEGRFNQLIEYSLDASSKVRRITTAERRRFLDAAKVVNESLVGMWDANKAQAAAEVYGELRRCVAALDRVIELTGV